MKNKIFFFVASLTVLISCKNEIEKQKKTVTTNVEKITEKGKQLNVILLTQLKKEMKKC